MKFQTKCEKTSENKYAWTTPKELTKKCGELLDTFARLTTYKFIVLGASIRKSSDSNESTTKSATPLGKIWYLHYIV